MHWRGGRLDGDVKDKVLSVDFSNLRVGLPMKTMQLSIRGCPGMSTGYCVKRPNRLAGSINKRGAGLAGERSTEPKARYGRELSGNLRRAEKC